MQRSHCTAETVAEARAGDRAAFGRLYEHHAGAVKALCLRLTRNEGLAEDLTHDVFVQVLRRITTFRGDSAFSTWLYRVTANEVFRYMRRAKRDAHEEVAHGQSWGHWYEWNAAASVDIARAINALAPGYREMLILHEIAGLEYPEIAGLLGCTIGNCKSQLSKGKAKVRRALNARLPHPSCETQASPEKISEDFLLHCLSNACLY